MSTNADMRGDIEMFRDAAEGWPTPNAYTHACDDLEAGIDALLAEKERLRVALEGAISVAQWMSGSESFSPGGEAHDGWLRQREVLFAAMKVLEAVRG